MTTEPEILHAEAPMPEVQPEANPAINPLEAELKNWQDKALRAAAELDNFRKRSANEIADARAYGITAFARDVLPVADNLARALEAPQGNEQALRDGVKMVAEQFANILAKHGVAMVPVIVGEALNPDLHQPMQQVPSEHPSGHIVAHMQAGYTINGRLIRPAFVSVSAGPNN